MKNGFAIRVALLALAGALACSKKNAENNTASLYIQVSDSKIVFGVDGGVAMLALSSNGTVTCGSVPSGFAVAQEGNAIYMVKAGVNATAGTVSGELVFTAKRGKETATATVTLVQRTGEAVNLSADGLANCYIAPTRGTYRFNAQVKGNGSRNDGGSGYVRGYGLDIKGGAYAALLWESRHDGDRSLTYEVIEGAPVYHNGYITFSTGRSEGNAVIAVKDMRGEILWSWHIWVTDTPVTSHDHILPTSEGVRKVVAQVMDRNLGAKNNEPMDIGNRGLFYQWGRKDPFVPSRTPYRIYEKGEYNLPSDNEPNEEIGDGILPWDISTDNVAPKTETHPGNIAYSIQCPTRYIFRYTTEKGYTWYVSSLGEDESVAKVRLWGISKTLFDPCPAGYKVPRGGLYARFEEVTESNAKERTEGRVDVEEGVDEYAEENDFLWGPYEHCGRIWIPTGDFYPMPGNFVPVSEEGYNHYTGRMGMYWTVAPDEIREGAKAYFEREVYLLENSSASSEYKPMQFAGQIRCIKE